MAPFAKVGGLADVVQGLSRALRAAGHDVRVVIPDHGAVGRDRERGREVIVPGPRGPHPARLIEAEGPGGVPVTLVSDEQHFGRKSIYGEIDDRDRYEFLCRTAAHRLEAGDWVPDIVHVHDWHTAPLAFALRNLAWRMPALRSTASVLTIHNLRYRGPDDFNDILGPGIYYADAVTTVSRTYAQEILSPAGGEGLDDLLRLRAGRLTGIVNGLDTDLFDPARDPALPEPFGLGALEARFDSRQALWDATALGPGPVAAMVTRLTEQKGVDLVLGSVSTIVRAGWRLVVLGSGDAHLEKALAAAQAADPSHVRFVTGYNDPLARLIYGGADLLLMPSRFEPCGLGQMIAMRYGCVPLGHRTGGLADTIDDSCGFLFQGFNVVAFEDAFERAAEAFRDETRWRGLQRAGMARDWSWTVPAERYVEVYRAALAGHR